VDLFPAIDIRNGRVVRLSQGEAARQTVYGDDPSAVAERFAEQGARWIHVVDLDRAFGDGDNGAAVRAIVARVGGQVRVQVGGGFRTLERIQKGLELGAARLVVGTAAAADPAFVPAAIEAAGAERLAIGIDTRNGMVAVRGWAETSSLAAADLARRVVEQGLTTVIYTDIARDGMLAGPDVAGAAALQRVGAHVIVSGGVSGVADIRAVCEAGLAGAIVGRALYEGRLTCGEACEAAERCDPFSYG
jgi:phosphoribosylformimino-5-aminoimidazole carboxamide ribotide isomerase